MNDGEHALDVLDELRWSLHDYAALRKAVRGRTRRGHTVDSSYATEAITACLSDVLQSCRALTEGQRDGFAAQLASLAVASDIQVEVGR